jgi:hypothetical protein
MRLKIGANFAIFIIFFGIALNEAIQKNNWLEALLFSALGIMFLRTNSINSFQNGKSSYKRRIRKGFA